MKILTRDHGATVGTVQLEPSDITKYVGHFTVDTLLQAAEELRKLKGNRMVALKTIYNPSGCGCQSLLVVLDDDTDIVEVGNPIPTGTSHIFAAGCAHGENGTVP